jgi:hypothetical protein
MRGVQPAFYAGQAHQGYEIPGPHHLGQGIPSPAWGNNSGIFQGYPSAYSMDQNPQSSQGFHAGPVLLQSQQPPESWTGSRNMQGQTARETPGTHAPQSQWQISQHGQFGSPSEGLHMNAQPSTIPKPIFGSFSSQQDVEPSPREFAHRTSNPPLMRDAQSYQSPEENFPGNSPHSMVDNARNGQGYPILRSHSQQAPTNPALHGFSPLQHVQSQYQRQHMIRTRSDLPTAQNHQQYYNPMAQGDVHQYDPQHIGHGGGPAPHVHQMPYHQPRPYSEHSPVESGRASGTQFVSGPWTSTPPSAGQS